MPSAVYCWTPDGDVRRVSPHDGTYWVSCIAPDGTHCVFAGGRDGEASRIWRCELESGEVRPLTPEGWFASLPSFGAGGAAIVFSANDDPRARGLDAKGLNIFEMSPDGSNLRRLTTGSFRDSRPAISPDGTRVAFFSDRTGAHALWTVDASGTAEPELLSDESVGRPWWSLDGSTLYGFKVARDTCRTIAIDPSSGAYEPLANDIGHTHGQYHDPTADRLIIHSTQGTLRMSIWELPLDGSPATALVPPGFADQSAAHCTRAINGMATFDGERDHEDPAVRVVRQAERDEMMRTAMAEPTVCWGSRDSTR